MTKKIFYSIIIVAGTILLSSIIIIMSCLYDYFEGVREQGLKDELELSLAAVEKEGIQFLEKVKSDRYRITWIGTDGAVLYDTATENKKSENHLERAEVRSALETGEGQSNRYSDTLLEKTMYYAKRMENGTILRISTSSATVGSLALGMLQPILIVIVIALVMSGILADSLSKRIVRPLNDLDLEDPLENDTYGEIAPLLRRIDRQNKEIQAQFKEQERRAAEFAQITRYMNEGLVLMDKQGTVLSINPAAREIFNLKQDPVGRDFLEVYRDHEMNACLKNALESGHSEIHQTRSGRDYQFDVSRIGSDGAVVGTVLLIFDTTEKAQAERNRREFTANVSHELKTPLQGIIGSAELIENGMVGPEDLPRFVGHIRKEASRLVSLVNDIIRLSQLDEKAEAVREPTDLLTIARETAEDLKELAEDKEVKIIVSGTPVTIEGVRRLLYEIIYNLCDNAIKYNVRGGNVKISVARSDQEALLTVADTGIGIPPEHLDRVFERFYRVDKSHSKETGGTGLGLSIVKHAAAFHHGTVDIESRVGVGTVIQLRLPLDRH